MITKKKEREKLKSTSMRINECKQRFIFRGQPHSCFRSSFLLLVQLIFVVGWVLDNNDLMANINITYLQYVYNI